MKNSIRRALVAAVALVATSIAHAEIAVVVHPDNPIANMTLADVAAIYLGRNERLRPIDLPETGGLYNWFYYQVTGWDVTRVKISRAKHLDKMPPALAFSSIDAIRRVASNKRAIAYVDTRAVDSSVKVVMTIRTPALLDRFDTRER